MAKLYWWKTGGLTQIGTGTIFSELSFKDTTNNGGGTIKDNIGNLWTWGGIYNGQNTGTTYTTPVPFTLSLGHTWINIADGDFKQGGFAIDDNNELFGWGYNAYQIIDNTKDIFIALTFQSVPQASGQLWSYVTQGQNCVLAIDTAGRLWFWGNNNSISSIITTTPIQLATGETFISVDGSNFNACAIHTDNTLWRWGNNYNNIPTQVGSDIDWKSATVGYSLSGFGAAIKNNNTVYTWGNASTSGHGFITSTPTLLTGFTNVIACAAGVLGGVALLNDNNLYVWGLANGGGYGYTYPTQVFEEYYFTDLSAGDELAALAGGVTILPDFCANPEANYSITEATCGNIDGEIIINNSDYLILYDFTLTDVTGTSYTLFSGRYNVTAGWYNLTATPKEEYWSTYGRDGCDFTWIPINNSDTTITLDNKSVRETTCNTFGAENGRIVYFCSDTGGVGDYDIYLFNKAGDIVSQTNQADISEIIFTNLKADNYYLMVLNNDGANGGCRLIDGPTQVKAITNIAINGIKRIFVTEWNSLIEYNYWSASDQEYYVSSLDDDFFTSIKIKEFIDVTLSTAWFEIIMDTKGVTYGQVMNKTKQGFVFTDTLEITIPHADNNKWKTLVDFLVNRYIIVFLDNNHQYWVMGYRHGAKVDNYKRSDNQYILTMNAVSENKIVTNIDEDYVVNNIINQ